MLSSGVRAGFELVPPPHLSLFLELAALCHEAGSGAVEVAEDRREDLPDERGRAGAGAGALRVAGGGVVAVVDDDTPGGALLLQVLRAAVV